MTATDLKKKLKCLAEPKRAEVSLRFFQTQKGGYGEGDQFLGVTVPDQRKVAKQFKSLKPPDLEKLLQSSIHEHRLTSLFIIVRQFERGNENQRKQLIALYKRNLRYVNNWDLVDSSAPYLLGVYLQDRSKSILYQYAKSPSLWRRRVGVLSTFGFIKQGEYKDSLAITKILLNDQHDLIHKASGWMLREIGKRDKDVLVNFLNKHCETMPRTMLRYAIEKFNDRERSYYMKQQRKLPIDRV